jgi:hypothetical protein
MLAQLNNNASFPVKYVVWLDKEDCYRNVDEVVGAAVKINAYSDREGIRFFYIAFQGEFGGEEAFKVRRFTKEGLVKAMEKRRPRPRKPR